MRGYFTAEMLKWRRSAVERVAGPAASEPGLKTDCVAKELSGLGCIGSLWDPYTHISQLWERYVSQSNCGLSAPVTPGLRAISTAPICIWERGRLISLDSQVQNSHIFLQKLCHHLCWCNSDHRVSSPEARVHFRPTHADEWYTMSLQGLNVE